MWFHMTSIPDWGMGKGTPGRLPSSFCPSATIFAVVAFFRVFSQTHSGNTTSRLVGYTCILKPFGPNFFMTPLVPSVRLSAYCSQLLPSMVNSGFSSA